MKSCKDCKTCKSCKDCKLNKRTLNLLIFFLGVMCFYDFSLHLVALFDLVQYHPLYPIFPSVRFYEIFWTFYWEVATVLTLIIWGAVNGKNR